jgi:oligopeptide transport system substrate-binding protein
MLRHPAIFALGLLLLASCAPAAAPNGGPAGSPGSAAPSPSKVLTIEVRAEPASVARKALSSGIGTSFATTQRLFNAYLGIMDAQGNPQPYLADALPTLNSPDWQVFPDGQMETTHRLKPNLTWQDGAPLTTDDFVFAWRFTHRPRSGSPRWRPRA